MNDENLVYVAVNRKRNCMVTANPVKGKMKIALPSNRPPLKDKNMDISFKTAENPAKTRRRSSAGMGKQIFGGTEVDNENCKQLTDAVELEKEVVQPDSELDMDSTLRWSLEQYCDFLRSNTTNELFNKLKLHVISKVTTDDTPEQIVGKVTAYLKSECILQSSGKPMIESIEAQTAEPGGSAVTMAQDLDLTSESVPPMDEVPTIVPKIRRRRRTADHEILEAGLLQKADGTPSPPCIGIQTRRSKRLRKSLCLYKDQPQNTSRSQYARPPKSQPEPESQLEPNSQSQPMLESLPESMLESLPEPQHEFECLMAQDSLPEADSMSQPQIDYQSTCLLAGPSQSGQTTNAAVTDSFLSNIEEMNYSLTTTASTSGSISEELVALYTNKDKTLPTQKPLLTIFEERPPRTERYSSLLRSFHFTEGYYYYPTCKKISQRRKLIKKYGLHNAAKNRPSADAMLDQILAKLDQTCLAEDGQ